MFGGGGMLVPACHPEKSRNISSCFMVMIAEMSLSLSVFNTDFTTCKFVYVALSMLVCYSENYRTSYQLRLFCNPQ